MKHQAIHFNIAELGFMSNLLYMAMQATGKEFKDQAPEVKILSTKIARAYTRLEIQEKQRLSKIQHIGGFKVTTTTEIIKNAS